MPARLRRTSHLPLSLCLCDARFRVWPKQEKGRESLASTDVPKYVCIFYPELSLYAGTERSRYSCFVLSACISTHHSSLIQAFGMPIGSRRSSRPWPTRKSRSSAKGGPISCMPTGSPLSRPRPTGRERPGRPARFKERV